MESSVVLLSGGMDSATALFWALKYTHVKAVINFDYGQRGAVFEYSKACKLVDFIRAQKGEGAKGIQFIQQAYHFPSQSALLAGSPLIDLERDQRELPATFVPARNLIFISIGLSLSSQKQLKRYVSPLRAHRLAVPRQVRLIVPLVSLIASGPTRTLMFAARLLKVYGKVKRHL